MADISKITLPNGSSYDIKDATARSGLAGKAAASHTHVKSEVGLGNVDNTADTDKNVKSATKLQTYKQGSTTLTYGDQYPLYAQWETNSILKLVCSGYTVKTDYATNAGNADTVDSKHASDFAAVSHTHTTQSAEATSDANASYLRQIATGTAEATTTNCPNGCLYGQYS